MKKLVLALLLFSFSSCSEEEIILQTDQDLLVKVVSEMHTMDEIIKKIPEIQRDSLREDYMAEICQINKVTLEQIEGDLESLKKNEKKFKAFYDLVVEKLEKDIQATKLRNTEEAKYKK